MKSAALLLLLLSLIRWCCCRLLDRHASKLYFQLLQSSTDDYVPDKSPNPAHRRPEASDYLPLVNLVEDDDDVRDPRASDINLKQLQQLLGPQFDPEFMSLVAPRRRVDKLLIQFINGRPRSRRPHFLGLLRSARLQDGTKLELNAPKSVRRKLQKFLWNFTFCPVIYSWTFLGPRVWPQWIREGSCYSERSCSVPPGMTCKQTAQTYKTFLRWHCEDFQKRRHCRWMQFLYPVITECSCSC